MRVLAPSKLRLSSRASEAETLPPNSQESKAERPADPARAKGLAENGKSGSAECPCDRQRTHHGPR